MSTKKTFVEIVTFLQQNKAKKVEDILDDILKLTVSKKQASVVKRDDNGEVTEIFCWYHKEWEKIADCEYGSKASTETGLNTMCKIGVNQWTRQQAEYKKAQADLLLAVGEGEVKPSEVKSRLAELELAKDRIVTRKTSLEEIAKKEKEKKAKEAKKD